MEDVERIGLDISLKTREGRAHSRSANLDSAVSKEPCRAQGIQRAPTRYMGPVLGLPRSLEEEKRRIEKEAATLQPVELVNRLQFDRLSSHHVKSGTMCSSSGSCRLLMELPEEPRIAKILEAGTSMRETDPAGYNKLVEALREGLEQYITDFPERGFATASVLEPKGAVAWPYLLAKLSAEPEDLVLISDAATRYEATYADFIEQEYQQSRDTLLAGDPNNMMDDSITLEMIEAGRTTRTFGAGPDSVFAFAAAVCLDKICEDENLSGALTDNGHSALGEYADYQRRFLEMMQSRPGVQATGQNATSSPVFNETLDSISELDGSRDSPELQPQGMPAEREDIILEYARRVAESFRNPFGSGCIP